MQIHKRTKDRPRAIHYSHQSKHLVMGLHITHVTNIARKQQSKNHISQGKGKIRWRWYLLEWLMAANLLPSKSAFMKSATYHEKCFHEPWAKAHISMANKMK